MLTGIIERSKEMGILKALGASGGDVTRMMLYESAVLGAVGGFLGCVVPIAVFLQGMLIPITSASMIAIQIFPEIFLYGFTLSIVVSTLASLYPVWRAIRVRNGIRSQTSRDLRRAVRVELSGLGQDRLPRGRPLEVRLARPRQPLLPRDRDQQHLLPPADRPHGRRGPVGIRFEELGRARGSLSFHQERGGIEHKHAFCILSMIVFLAVFYISGISFSISQGI